jgi:integrase/recombinase XerD
MAQRKAPPGCYWRSGTLHGRVKVRGRDIRFSLHTSDPAVARTRYKAKRERLIGDAHHGDSPRTFVEALEGWATWIERRVGPKTVQRYACSLDQLRPFVDGRRLSEIDGRLVAEIIRARTADGVSNATIRRDLVALSSVVNFLPRSGLARKQPGAGADEAGHRATRDNRVAAPGGHRSRARPCSWDGQGVDSGRHGHRS